MIMMMKNSLLLDQKKCKTNLIKIFRWKLTMMTKTLKAMKTTITTFMKTTIKSIKKTKMMISSSEWNSDNTKNCSNLEISTSNGGRKDSLILDNNKSEPGKPVNAISNCAKD